MRMQNRNPQIQISIAKFLAQFHKYADTLHLLSVFEDPNQLLWN